MRQPSVKAVGLDMNDSGLCWVALCDDKQHGRLLQACQFEPLAPGWIVKGQIVDFGQVEAALGRLLHRVRAAMPADAGLSRFEQLSQRRRKAKPVALALAVPSLLVALHRARYPADLSEAMLTARVKADLAGHLQCLPADVCADFRQDLAAPDAGNPRAIDVLAAAVPREAVEDRVALIEAIGLPVHVAMVGSAQEAGLRAARHLMASQTPPLQGAVALIQMEARWFQLDILDQSGPVHGERFSLAEPFATVPSFVLPEGLVNALLGFSGEPPLRVWVSGPAEAALACAAVLQQHTGLPCERINVLQAMVSGDSVGSVEGNGAPHGPRESEALVACGLALMALAASSPSKSAAKRTSPFNFLPHRQAALAHRQKRFVLQLGAVALCGLLATAGLRLALSAQLASQHAAQTAVRQEIARLDAEIKRMAAAAPQAQRFERDAAALKAFAQRRQQLPQLLRELSGLLPEGLHLTSLRCEPDGSAILAGQARSPAEVFELIERMTANSPSFKRPALLDLSWRSDPGLAALASSTGSSVVVSGPAQLPAAAPSSVGLVERVAFTLRAQSP